MWFSDILIYGGSMSERNRTKYIILGMLTIQPSSGYEINKMIKNSTSYFWAESEGQIYPALAKCLAEGLVTCVEELSNDSARLKKIYSITEPGREQLAAWLKKEAQKPLIRSEFLLKIFFAGNIDNKYAIAHILKLQEDMRKELIELEKTKKKLQQETCYSSTHTKFWLLSIESGIKSAHTELLWCEEALKILA